MVRAAWVAAAIGPPHSQDDCGGRIAGVTVPATFPIGFGSSA